MQIPFAAYSPAVVLFAIVALLLGVGVFLALAKRKRALFWTLFISCASSAVIAGTAFLRLERMHTDLVSGSPGIKTKADILKRYGPPSETDSYQKDGRIVECWIYEVTLFNPRIRKQFEMIDDVVWATMQRN
jgi:hypothetical protein